MEKVRYPIEEVPAKPSEPKSRKPKKVKTTAVDKAHHKEKKTEPAVRIEPLVINESFSEMEYEEPFDWTKKAETKKTKVPKKGVPFIFCMYSCRVGYHLMLLPLSTKLPKITLEASLHFPCVHVGLKRPLSSIHSM